MARWIKIPLGMEIGLGPGQIVLDGDPAPSKGHSFPIFGPMSVVVKRLDGSTCHLAVDKISTNLERRAVPLRWLSFLFI